MVTDKLKIMKKLLKTIGVLAAVFLLTLTSCDDDIEPAIEEIDFDRVFMPLELSAQIRNMVNVELTWDHRGDAESYVVEISQDGFNSTVVSASNIKPEDLPFTATLEGETAYSARVKGVSAGKSDSKWAVIEFETDPENIFETVNPEEIGSTNVTLRWPAESEVTHFMIVPGDVQRPIADGEKTAGEATITALMSGTEYTITLFNDAKRRGQVVFTTLVASGTIVSPEDNLADIIAAAEPGDTLALESGDYTVYTGSITLNKSITIQGIYPHDKPVIHVQFLLEDGVEKVELKDLEIVGDNELNNVVQYGTADVAYGALTISGCVIRDFTRSLVSATGVASTVEAVVIDNCVVTDVMTDGGDFIDFRSAHVGSLSITNSTFDNSSPGRDFIRLDDSSGTFPGRTSKVLIEYSTFYGVSDSDSRRILYVRFVDNTLEVNNCIFAETEGYYTNQSKSAQPDCSDNNYFNAPGFTTAAYVSGAKIDQGDYTTLDPGFADPDNGDFTLSNQTLIDKQVGDPRWR